MNKDFESGKHQAAQLTPQILSLQKCKYITSKYAMFITPELPGFFSEPRKRNNRFFVPPAQQFQKQLLQLAGEP